MNINNELVQQVKEGTHCAEFDHTNVKHNVGDFIAVRQAIKEVTYGFYPYERYHWPITVNDQIGWASSNALPPGLTPIPLDLFFVVEEEKHIDAINADWRTDNLGRNAKQSSPPPTAEGESEYQKGYNAAKQYYEELLAIASEQVPKGAFPDVIELVRSFNSIVERKGRDTNWDALDKKVKGILAAKSTPPEKGERGQGDELSELREWKRQAIEVMPDFQEIGKLLNIPLGKSVSDNIIPKIKELLAASHPSPHTPVNLEDVKESLRHKFYKSTGRYYIDTPYTYIESLEKKIAEYKAHTESIEHLRVTRPVYKDNTKAKGEG